MPLESALSGKIKYRPLAFCFVSHSKTEHSFCWNAACLVWLFLSDSSPFSGFDDHCHHKHGSVYAGGFGCIGIVLAAWEGDAGSYDHGFLQVEYCVLVPSIIFAAAMLAEFWVEGLPSQVRRIRKGSMSCCSRQRYSIN